MPNTPDSAARPSPITLQKRMVSDFTTAFVVLANFLRKKYILFSFTAI